MKREKRLKWFVDSKYGIFIHWGLYSMLGRGEWVMSSERIPPAEYAKLADRFNPREFHPDEWAELAAAAGAKYAVLTTRHHDGFCLFDSKTGDFTSVKTAAKRDFAEEFAVACRRRGLRVGFYYSLGDWRFGLPKLSDSRGGAAAMVAQAHAQVRELMSNYGKIDILWYDGRWIYPMPQKMDWSNCDHLVGPFWRTTELNAMVRKLQPGIIINNRSGAPEDFGTPEQEVKPEDGRAWECCMTIGNARGWGYLTYDPTLKTAGQLMEALISSVAGGGNFLLNISPRADGSVPEAQKQRLLKIGRWLAANGESVYGTRSGAGLAPELCTARGGSVYLHLLWWPGRVLTLPGFKRRVVSAMILGSGEKLRTETDCLGRLVIKGLPAAPPDRLNSVIKIKLEPESSR